VPIFIGRGAPLYARIRCGDLGAHVRMRWSAFARHTTSKLPEGAHPNAAGLDDGEMARPIVTREDEVAEPRSDIARIWHRHAKQHHTARARQCRCSGQFAEVFVEGQQGAFVAGRPGEHIWIAHTWSGIPNPYDIMPGCNKRRDGCTGEIFVGKEAHVKLRWGRPFRNSACHAHMRGRL
jgi:hypothetical protein